MAKNHEQKLLQNHSTSIEIMRHWISTKIMQEISQRTQKMYKSREKISTHIFIHFKMQEYQKTVKNASRNT